MLHDPVCLLVRAVGMSCTMFLSFIAKTFKFFAAKIMISVVIVRGSDLAHLAMLLLIIITVFIIITTIIINAAFLVPRNRQCLSLNFIVCFSSDFMAAVSGFNVILHTSLDDQSTNQRNKEAYRLVQKTIASERFMSHISFIKQIRSGAAIHLEFSPECPPSEAAIGTIRSKLEEIGRVYAATPSRRSKARCVTQSKNPTAVDPLELLSLLVGSLSKRPLTSIQVPKRATKPRQSE